MKPESEDPQSLLLDALLQEQNRTNREASLQAIEAAIAASSLQSSSTRTRNSRAPWLVGIAATVAISASILHQQGVFRPHEPIIASHHVQPKVQEEARSLPDNTGAQGDSFL